MATTYTSGRARRTRAVVAILAALAVAPAAQARPLDPGYQAPTPVISSPASPSETIVVRDGGFDWSDAAVGAAAAGGLVALLGAATLTRTRTRTHDQAPFGAR